MSWLRLHDSMRGDAGPVPGLPDGERYPLCRALERGLSLPGPALVLWAGESPTLQEIRAHARVPVFTR